MKLSLEVEWATMRGGAKGDEELRVKGTSCVLGAVAASDERPGEWVWLVFGNLAAGIDAARQSVIDFFARQSH